MKTSNPLRDLLTPLCLCLLCQTAMADKWLPRHPDPDVKVRLLGCTYDGARLTALEELNTSSENWKVWSETDTVQGGIRWVFEALHDMRQAGVAVAFDRYGWTSDNYVMVPSAIYGGNRQRIVNRTYATGLDGTDYNRPDLALTSNPIPQLSPEFGAPSMFELLVCNAATPVITWYDRKAFCGAFLFTDQGTDWQGNVLDHGLTVEESADRSMATFVVSAPGVRGRKPEFVGFSESPDRGVDIAAGQRLTIRVDKVDVQAADVSGFLARFMQERKRHLHSDAPRNLMPMSEVLQRMCDNIEERYHVGEKWQYYCPENADWMSYGWIGGLINTYPMLATGDEERLRRVVHTFDFALMRGYGQSGYFYDVLGSDGKVFNRDAAALHPGIGLTRKNGDLLYWTVKQFGLLKRQGRAEAIRPEWEERVKALADAFVKTWKEQGTWGNYLHIEDGRVAVYNTTSGAMAIGGLALASAYYGHAEYLEIARKAAMWYYKQFALLGFTSGGCGDILQNADSETACALMTALMTMYETTGESKYLQQSAHLAQLCSTWTVSFCYRMPSGTPLAALGANLTGAVWASTQNKHGAPGFCTQSGDALFKLYRATGDTLYAELLRDIIHAHAEGIQPNGKISERLTYCDADSRGGRGDGWKTGWNETNGALMALEIPGIYARTDTDRLYCFDHIQVRGVHRSHSALTLILHNPTDHEATVTVLAEDSEQAQRPLGDNAFTEWAHKVKIGAHKTVKTTVKPNKH